MSQSISNTTWVYVIIKKSNGSEQLAGFEDKNGVKYLPVIKSKEDSEVFLSYMDHEKGVRFEIQAIIYEDVILYAKENGFNIFIVDKNGKILEKINNP